jgi:hypothetical protein
MKRRATFAYGGFGIVGIALYVFGYSPRFWALPAIIAVSALVVVFVEEIVVLSQEIRR